MNVIQRPDVQSFCGSMKDYVIDSDSSITFSVLFEGKTVLNESYAPDKDFQIRIRKLGKFCALSLWGKWCDDGMVIQNNAAGKFTFKINDVTDFEGYVMMSRLFTQKPSGNPGFLSEVREKVARFGMKEYMSALLFEGNEIVLCVRTVYDVVEPMVYYRHEGDKGIVTFDVGPDSVLSMFPGISKSEVRCYEFYLDNHVIKFFIDHTQYSLVNSFRFKNVYDLPETITTVGDLTIKGNNESETGFINGVARKFSLEVTDEYTANSGVVFFQSDYRLWHNFLNSQEVQIVIDGDWYPIKITKQNYERSFRKSALKAVSFSFVMADPDFNNLL